MVRDLPPSRDSLPETKGESALKLEALWREIDSLQRWVPPEKLEVLRLSLSELLKADKASPATFSQSWMDKAYQTLVEDELRQQNEELTLARQMVDAERQHYRELFDFAPDGYLVTSSVGTILDANHAAAALLGARKEVLIGKPLIEFVAHKDRAVFLARLTDLQTGALEKASDWEIELRAKEELPVPASLTVGGVRNSDGQLVGLRWSLRDITERKRAEEMLHDAEARYRVLAESAQALITRSTPEGVYLYVSPACRTLLGFEPEDMVGHSGYEFLHSEDLPTIQASHQALEQLPDTFTVTYRLRHKDGSYPRLLNTIRVVRDPQTNKVVELLAISRNVAQN